MTSSTSDARPRTVFQMSMVKIVELLLKIDVRELISAAICRIHIEVKTSRSIKPLLPSPPTSVRAVLFRKILGSVCHFERKMACLLNVRWMFTLTLPTLRHEFQDKLGIRDVCAAVTRTAHLLTHVRIHAANFVWRNKCVKVSRITEYLKKSQNTKKEEKNKKIKILVN